MRCLSVVVCVMSLVVTASALESHHLNVKSTEGSALLPHADDKESFLQTTTETQSGKLLAPTKTGEKKAEFVINEKAIAEGDYGVLRRFKFLGKEENDLLIENQRYSIKMRPLKNAIKRVTRDASMLARISTLMKGGSVPDDDSGITYPFEPVAVTDSESVIDSSESVDAPPEPPAIVPAKPGRVTKFMRGLYRSGKRKVGDFFTRNTKLLEIASGDDSDDLPLPENHKTLPPPHEPGITSSDESTLASTWEESTLASTTKQVDDTLFVVKYKGCFLQPKALEYALRKSFTSTAASNPEVEVDESVPDLLFKTLENIRASGQLNDVFEAKEGPMLMEVIEDINKGSLENAKNWFKGKKGEDFYAEMDALAPFIFEFGFQLFSTITWLGRNGILHGDLRPQNVLLTMPEDGMAVETRLADFSQAQSWNGKQIEKRIQKADGPFSSPESHYCNDRKDRKRKRDSEECFPARNLGTPHFNAADVYAAGKTIITLFGVPADSVDYEENPHPEYEMMSAWNTHLSRITFPASTKIVPLLARTLHHDTKKRTPLSEMVESLDIRKLWIKLIEEYNVKPSNENESFYRFYDLLEEPMSYCNFLRAASTILETPTTHEQKRLKAEWTGKSTDILAPIVRYVSKSISTFKEGKAHLTFLELCGKPGLATFGSMGP